MKFDVTKESITFEKELNTLDEFTLRFTKILDEQNVCYVIISGYAAILFGRNRASEDVDLFIENISFEKFTELWDKIRKTFDCLNTTDPHHAYETYLLKGESIRFATKQSPIPNMEVKFPKTPLDQRALKNKIRVTVNSDVLFVSPIEQQISFKLFLGTEKDIEDAVYLYEIFKEFLDEHELNIAVQKLNVGGVAENYLWTSRM